MPVHISYQAFVGQSLVCLQYMPLYMSCACPSIIPRVFSCVGDNTIVSIWHVMPNDPTGSLHDIKYARLFNLTTNQFDKEW